MKVLLISIRVFGFIVSFFFLFVVVANLINGWMNPAEVQNSVWMNPIFYSLVFVSSFAYFLAWRHEGLGGLILTICAIVLSSFSDWKLGIPFFTVGQLFVFYWVMKKRSLSNQLKSEDRKTST